MSSRNILIYVLAFLLVGSNLLWLESGLNQRAKANEPALFAASSSNPDCYPNEVARDLYFKQLLPLSAAVKASAQRGATRESIVSAATKAAEDSSVARQANVCVNRNDVESVGSFGLQFDAQGRLIGIATSVCAY